MDFSNRRGQYLVAFIAILLITIVMSLLYRNYSQLINCPKQDRIIALQENKKIVLISLCQKQKIEELNIDKGVYYYIGQEGILELTANESKISVPVPTQLQISPNEVQEDTKYYYKQLKYYSFAFRKWTTLTIPKLVDNPTKYESILFNPSIDNNWFVVYINLYDTQSDAFLNEFAGPSPVSTRYLILNPETGVYYSYSLDKARQAFNKLTSQNKYSIFDLEGCTSHALKAKKIYAYPCGEGIGSAGPIAEYSFISNLAKIVTFETKADQINDQFLPVIPDDTDIYYYLSQNSSPTYGNGPELYKVGQKTRFYIFDKGTDKPLVSSILENINLDLKAYGARLVNVINSSTGSNLYFASSKRLKSTNKEVQFEVTLYKTDANNGSSLTQISIIDGVHSCGNNALIYIPSSQNSLIYVNGNSQTRIDIPELKNRVSYSNSYSPASAILWCN